MIADDVVTCRLTPEVVRIDLLTSEVVRIDLLTSEVVRIDLHQQ